MVIDFFNYAEKNNFEEKIHHTYGGLIAHDSGQTLKNFGWLKRMLIVVSGCVETYLSGIVKGRAEEDLLTGVIITDPPLLGKSLS